MLAAAVIAAQAACLPTADLYARLRSGFEESRAMAGISTRGTVLEIWSSPSGTWTAMITRPDGTSCVVDAGSGIAAFQPEAPGDPA